MNVYPDVFQQPYLLKILVSCLKLTMSPAPVVMALVSGVCVGVGERKAGKKKQGRDAPHLAQSARQYSAGPYKQFSNSSLFIGICFAEVSPSRLYELY